MTSLVTRFPGETAVLAAAVLVLTWLTWRKLRRWSLADLLTALAAALATVVASTGMWRFFGVVLHFSGPDRVLLFAYLEVAMMAAAVQAKRNMDKFKTAGPEGIAVWGIAALSGVLAALAARSVGEAASRIVAPLLAAWLWHRALALVKREEDGKATHWRLTGERVLVWLGLAEPAARETGEVAAHRRIARLAKAAKRAREHKDGTWRRKAAMRVLERRLAAAVEHADLATDEARQDQMLAQIGTLNAAGSLASMSGTAPWERPRVPAPVSRAGLLDSLAAAVAARLPEPEPWPEAPLPAQPDPVQPEWADDALAELDGMPPLPDPAQPPARRTVQSRRRKPQPAVQPRGRRTVQPAAAPKPGDPDPAAVREAASANALAEATGISRWRAQELRAPGSYAMRPLMAVNGKDRP